MHVPATNAAIRPQLEIVAQAPVPTEHGVFQMSVFHWDGERHLEHNLSPDHVALVMGDVRGKAGVLVRVHSECLTSEVFGSLKCDCRQQLVSAQNDIARAGLGIILYLRQEGRGIGLSNKLKAYQLQSRGADTVDANRLLGLPDDARDYRAASAMLQHLGPASIRLITNNPLKVDALAELGVAIDGRVDSHVGSNAFSAGYLETKRARMGHVLPKLVVSGGRSDDAGPVSSRRQVPPRSAAGDAE